MEEHFLSNLVVGVERETIYEPWYNPDGDCIVYQMVDEAIIADRIDDVLTIYRSAITGNPVGYQIKGVAALARIFGLDGISVISDQDHHELKRVSVFAILLAAYERGPKTISRRRSYAVAMESSRADGRLEIGELQLV
ncbi:MAG: hypothetical protein WBD81_17820 [Collimonas pratensis]|uniref:hypothetical protein n=1 Tax=Collimonas pratensis TaxID=279113 RepID=UPI003C7768DD